MREAEIFKAWLGAWESVTNSATLLPGLLHEHQANADNVPNIDESQLQQDYGILTVTENPIVITPTGGGVVREHLVEIAVKTKNGLQSLGSVLHAMADTTNGIPGKLPPHTSLDNGGTIIDIWPAPGKASTTTDLRRQNRAISSYSIGWRVRTDWAF